MRAVRLVEQRDERVAVAGGLRVVGPVPVALLPPLLHAPGQHDDGAAVLLPHHPPEVVAGRVQGALRHQELTRGVEALEEWMGVSTVKIQATV